MPRCLLVGLLDLLGDVAVVAVVSTGGVLVDLLPRPPSCTRPSRAACATARTAPPQPAGVGGFAPIGLLDPATWTLRQRRKLALRIPQDCSRARPLLERHASIVVLLLLGRLWAAFFRGSLMHFVCRSILQLARNQGRPRADVLVGDAGLDLNVRTSDF